MGRAARHVDGRVILFCNKITKAIEVAVDVTNKRRDVQMKHNKKHNITPKTTVRSLDENLRLENVGALYESKKKEKLPAAERQKIVAQLTRKMKDATKSLDFEIAIRYRDEIEKIKKL